MEEPKRHCWECSRRQLVCDFTRPECKRCSRSGTACPGYGDAKPVTLRWLAPGRVKFRNHRKPRNKPDDKTTNTATEIALSHTGKEMAPRICPEIKLDLGVFTQATDYYNTYIYPTMLPISEITPSASVFKISPMIFQHCSAYPNYVRLIIVCMSLSHQMCRSEEQYNALSRKFFHYRGLIISGLRDDITVEHKSTSNFVIAGMLTLLLVDAHQGASHNSWRYHLDGVRKLIRLRGGIQILTETPGVVPLLLCFTLFAVLGDTSSPASDLAMIPEHRADLEFMLSRYADVTFVFTMFPAPLFSETIKINYLRMRAVKQMANPEVITIEAYGILGGVLGFSPEEFADSKPTASKEDVVLLGNVYQAAVAIYCISSLQSLSVLPTAAPFLTSTRIEMSERLHLLLSEALVLHKYQRLLLWPLMVLGVEAVNRDTKVRVFVQEQLLAQSRSTGIFAPQIAKGVLEVFWASGKTRWDDCFDEPYMFVTYGSQGLDLRNL